MALSATQIARMQATVAEFLPATCALQRATRTSDGAGGYTESYATVTGMATLACRVYYRSVRGDVAGERTLAEREPIVHLPYGTAVLLRDHIVTGGRTFEVVASMPQPEGISLQVACKEIF